MKRRVAKKIWRNLMEGDRDCYDSERMWKSGVHFRVPFIRRLLSAHGNYAFKRFFINAIPLPKLEMLDEPTESDNSYIDEDV